jgi:hypothetical protein
MKRIAFLSVSVVAIFLLNGLALAQDTTLTITNTGNVGIGTTNPTEKFHVEGNLFLGKADESTRFVRMPRTLGGNNGNLELQAGGVTASSGTAWQGGNIVLRAGDLNTAGGAWAGSGSVHIFAGKNYFTTGYNGDIRFYAGSTYQERLTIVGDNGRIGVGTTAPDQLLSVNGNASKVGGGSWATFSDRRVKQDINPFSDGLSVLKGIRPVTFHYNGKLGYPTDKTYVGVIAQEIQSVAPYTVDTYRARLDPNDAEETDILRFDGSALTYIAINAIKELDRKVEEMRGLQKENQNLSERLSELEALVKSLAAKEKSADGRLVGELR